MILTKKMLGVIAGAIGMATIPASPADAARIQIDVIDVEIVIEVCVTIGGQTYCEVAPID